VDANSFAVRRWFFANSIDSEDLASRRFITYKPRIDL
jgi:hypothetical protein